MSSNSINIKDTTSKINSPIVISAASVSFTPGNSASLKPLIIINDKRIDKSVLEHNNVSGKTLTVYEGDDTSMRTKYGDDAKNGVLVFTDGVITPKDSLPKSVKPDKVFTKVENPPSFPGGEQAWHTYIKKIIGQNLAALINENQPGKCLLKFIVREDGSVIDIEALSMKKTKLAEVAIEALKNGPNWVPAFQNGHVVAAYAEIPVTFSLSVD